MKIVANLKKRFCGCPQTLTKCQYYEIFWRNPCIINYIHLHKENRPIAKKKLQMFNRHLQIELIYVHIVSVLNMEYQPWSPYIK